MKTGNIYIKAPMSVQVVNRKIFLNDVLEIKGNDAEAVKEIGGMILYTLKGDENRRVVFSLMKIIELIQKRYPGMNVQNIGQPDFVLEYKKPVSPRKWTEILKLFFAACIIFVGAAFTIMTFNTDVSVSDVFDHFYKIVMGSKKKSGTVLEASYCVGLFIGILVFYNHFSGKKAWNDPTPLHLEMRNYEEEMNKAIITDADRNGKELK